MNTNKGPLLTLLTVAGVTEFIGILIESKGNQLEINAPCITKVDLCLTLQRVRLTIQIAFIIY